MSEEVEALIHPSDDGKFWAEVGGLPGCYAQGDNYSKIIANLRDAHELCSASPSPATPTATALALPEGATVADLISTLTPEGWAATGEASAVHQLLQHGDSGAKLCVPLDSDAVLNAGFRKAVTSYLAGT